MCALTACCPPPLLQALSVPKSWFTYFYVLGFAVTLYSIADMHDRLVPSYMYVAPVLYLLHLARRVAECVFIHRFSSAARMPLHLWLAGVLHYLCVPWTLLPLHSTVDRTLHNAAVPQGMISSLNGLLLAMLAVLSLMWLAGNLWQLQAHLAFASFRNEEGSRAGPASERYVLPRGPLFESAWNPHYAAEVCIYFSLVMLRLVTSWNHRVHTTRFSLATDGVVASSPPTCALFERIASVAPLLLLLWVAINLTATGLKTRAWYIATFPHAARFIMSKPAVHKLLA